MNIIYSLQRDKYMVNNRKLFFVTFIFLISIIFLPNLVCATIKINPNYEIFSYIGRGTDGGTTLTSIPVGSTSFDYFEDDAVVNDTIYFGWNKGRWNSLKLYIGTPFVADNVTFVWEYWNGNEWANLSVVDNTNGFTNLGEHTVEFTPPTNWRCKTLMFSGSRKYDTFWIRCRIAEVTNITEGGAQSTTTAKHKRYEIEVTGDYSAYTNIFKKIYDADQTNGWGLTNLTEKGVQINCNVGFGDGSTTTIVKTQKESVSVRYDNIWIKPKCNFTAGILTEAGYTRYGSRIEVGARGLDYGMVWSGGVAKFYDTQILHSGEPFWPRKIVFSGNVDFQDVILEGFTKFSPWSTEFNVKRFKMKGGQWSGAYIGTVEDVIVQSDTDNTVSVVWVFTAKGLKVEGTAPHPYRIWKAYATLIDCEVSDDIDDWSFCCSPGYWVKIQNSFNLKLIDNNNNPIEGATVTLKNNNGTEVFSATTNSEGVIPEQLVTRTYFEMNDTYTATKTDYNPFTLTISHQDYPPKEYVITIDSPINWTISLKDRPKGSGIISVYGTEYSSGEEGIVYAQVLYGDGTPANNASCNVTIWNKGNIFISNKQMTHITNSRGVYYYNFTTPSEFSVYIADVVCENPSAYGSAEIHVRNITTSGGSNVTLSEIYNLSQETYNQTKKIYTFNVNNIMNPSFVLWLVLLCAGTFTIFLGISRRRISFLIISTILYMVSAFYSFNFTDIIGEAGVWVMIGLSLIGLVVSFVYTLYATVNITKKEGQNIEEEW